MFRNYLITALRNLVRNRLYTAINVVGLSVGFVAALFIGLFVRDEYSYDKWIQGYQDVYHVNTLVPLRGDGSVDEYAVSAQNVARSLILDFPQVERAARLSVGSMGLRNGDVEALEEAAWADPEFFGVLPLPVIAGDLAAALTAPDSIVLTRSMARKYFGTDTPIGEVIEFDRKYPLRVTAVLEDLPSNTQLTAQVYASGRAAFSALASMDSMPPASQPSYLRVHTYVRLRPGTAISAADIERFATQRMRVETSGVAAMHHPRFIPLADVHLDEAKLSTFGGQKPAGSRNVIYAVALIGVLIVAIAGMNFVNLMTARAGRRAIEVGVRKVSGAVWRHFILQFTGEAVLIAAFAMGMAVVAGSLMLNSFNAFLQRSIALDLLHDPILLLAMAVMVIVVGTLAGFYPAFVMSAYRPATALKGNAAKNAGAAAMRQILIVAQFAVLIGLAVGTEVIYRQAIFATHERLRFTDDPVVILNTACSGPFWEGVRALPGVRQAVCSSNSALNFSRIGTVVAVPEKGISNLRVAPVDTGFLEFYGLQPLAGRFFPQERAADLPPMGASNTNPPIVINETAMRALGFDSPAAAIGHVVAWSRLVDFSSSRFTEPLPSEIVGVAPDFSLASIRTPVEATVYYRNPGQTQNASIRLSGALWSETLPALDKLWREYGEPRPMRWSFLDQYLQGLHQDILRQSQLFAAFAAVAIFIACLGLFGLSAFSVEQRTKEIGIRKAMGATQGEILQLLLWQFSKPVLWANVIAWPAAYLGMRYWLQGFAYHIDLSPWMFLAASGLAAVIAVLTVIGHALLVARAQPVTALRYE